MLFRSCVSQSRYVHYYFYPRIYFIQDALVKAGVISNDGWQEIVSFEDRFGVDKVNPRVEVIIETVEKEREKHGSEEKKAVEERAACLVKTSNL